MSILVEGTPPYVRGTFQQTCGYCGCVFSVRVPGRIGYEGPENYYCPECHKRFPVKASRAPGVTLISKRCDGRKANYPNL